MSHLQWSTEKRKVKDLIPYEGNPRVLSEFQKEKLMESLQRFNLVEIPAIDTDNKIIAGHQRIKIMLLIGRGDEEIDVRIPNRKLTTKEFTEYNLRSNRNTGDWNYDLLKDLDIELLMDVGFDDADLAHIWDEQFGISDDEFNTDEELVSIKEPKTKIGDMYRLGRHRLLCGDATDSTDVDRLLKGAKVDLVYCDPPYNISLNYNKGIGSRKGYGGKTDDSKSDDEYSNFLVKTIQNLLKHTKKNCHFFYWCDQKYIGLLQSIYTQLGIVNKRVCLWIKNNANMTPQIAFSKVYEPCVYGTIGSPYLSPTATKFTEILNKDIDTGNRTIDDILDLLDIWLVKRIPGQDYEHPTEKPVTLHEKPLRRCTKPGGVVVDLFGGSGGTLIACEQMNRTCFMMEIEPIFCDLIIKRYEKLTGEEAVLCK